MYKIMVIEDDDMISGLVQDTIKNWGFEAIGINDFKKVIDQFKKYDPHLVLIDITLPFFNGYHWCTEIRKISKVPIVFISSAADNMNIVLAMNMGADDFIAKPFDMNVLVAKVQALIRRTYKFNQNSNMIEHKGVVLNIGDASISYRGQRIDLTKNEFKILQVLMESVGKVISRDLIMERLWETDSFIDDNTLTVNIARLRRKLEDCGIEDFIITKKGLGYMVRADE